MTTHPRFNIIDWDGKTITKPGLYRSVPMAAYHSGTICDGPSVSGGGLRKIFSESPARYYWSCPYNPKREEEPVSAAIILGGAAHHLLMGERWFSKHYVIRPDELMDPKTGEMKAWQGNRTVCKDWLAAQAAKNLIVLTDVQIEDVKGMAMSLGNHPLVQAGILRGLIEHSLFWKDDETGIWLKSRPDAIPTDAGDFCNLKTARSLQWYDLQRSISDYGYHMGAAMEREAARKVLGIEMASYSLVCVESTGPWCVRIVQLKPADLDLGMDQNRVALKAFAHGIKTGDWPGPGGHRDDAAFIDLTERYRELAKSRLEMEKTQ